MAARVMKRAVIATAGVYSGIVGWALARSSMDAPSATSGDLDRDDAAVSSSCTVVSPPIHRHALGASPSDSPPLPCALEVTPSTVSSGRFGLYDVVVVGGGIVGLATAREVLLRYPDKSVCVVEKERVVAAHQTGHNSGVIHAGMYYQPGSTMAKCCVEGAAKMYEYCEKHNLPHKRCGKMIVASTAEEHETVLTLYKRGVENGVKDLRVLDSKEIEELEPNVRGFSALYSPNTGIADYAAVARQMAVDVETSGRGQVKCNFEVKAIEEVSEEDNAVVVVKGTEPGQNGPTKQVFARQVITCAGLQADRVAQLADGKANPKIVPFRGRYLQMKPEYRDICSMNIYPVPSGGGIPVGIHFTPTVNQDRGHGTIIGPGASLAFAREGYTFTAISWRDLGSMATHLGLIKFVAFNFMFSLGEMWRDLNQDAFLRDAQKLVPSVTMDMVEPCFAGVMGQIFDESGAAANDYVFESKCLNGKVLHVRSAPSPACTSSLAIAEHVVNVASNDFGWN
eukprot:m.259050 g.259050  ORF g.259050 m.259050 type:complete len:510 (-) comp15549_c1_seq17:10598-12127(-)